MALPTIDPDLVSREYLRIAGGYGALAEDTSPACGLDIDNAGHLATNGDVTIDGELSTALITAQDVIVEDDFNITGRDLTWSEYLHAADGSPTSNSGCNAVSQTQVRLREVEFRSLDFVTALDRRAIFNFILPPHYAGGVLQLDLMWTISAGTPGGDVRWVANALNLSDDDPMNQAPAGSAGEDTAIAVHDLHTQTLTVTPTNASAGDFCNVVIIRNGSNALDTFDNTAQLIALRISNA